MRVADFDQAVLDRIDRVARHQDQTMGRHGQSRFCSQCGWLVYSVDRLTFAAWIARKYGCDFCERNPAHLTGSYMHRIECGILLQDGEDNG